MRANLLTITTFFQIKLPLFQVFIAVFKFCILLWVTGMQTVMLEEMQRRHCFAPNELYKVKLALQSHTGLSIWHIYPACASDQWVITLMLHAAGLWCVASCLAATDNGFHILIMDVCVPTGAACSGAHSRQSMQQPWQTSTLCDLQNSLLM